MTILLINQFFNRKRNLIQGNKCLRQYTIGYKACIKCYARQLNTFTCKLDIV